MLYLICLLCLLAVPLTVAGEQSAPRGEASTEPLPELETNPGRLDMLHYLPPDLADNAPLVVVLHGCTQDAAGHARESGWMDMADAHGLALLLPEQSRNNNPSKCFNWFNPSHAERDGNEARSIMAAVDHMLEAHALDTGQIFITGLSAGGSMAAALLAGYPERFAGGGIVAGIAVGCASTAAGAFMCMQGGDNRPASELGDEIHEARDHGGPWPRVSIWHGDDDSQVRPRNLDGLMRQWTDVHGLEQDAVTVSRIGAAERRRYGNGESLEGDSAGAGDIAAGQALVETWLVQDMGHGTPIEPDGEQACGVQGEHALAVGLCAPRHMLAFWGLAESLPEPDTAGWVCLENETDNARHVESGRAYKRFGLVYAKGSDEWLGFYFSPRQTRLAETSSRYWEQAPCSRGATTLTLN